MDNRTDKSQKWKSILGIAAVLAVLVAVGLIWGEQIVQLVADPTAFRAWVEDKGIWGPLAMIGAVVLQILVAFIPGEPFEVAAGYAFGAWRGLTLCLIGSFIGEMAAILLARRFGVRLLKTLFPKHDIENMEFFKNPDRLRFLTFILFLIPGTPKDVMAYALGLTPISVWEGTLLTCVARIPSILTSTLSGHALGEQQYLTAIIVYGLTGLVSLIAILLYRRHQKAQAK